MDPLEQTRVLILGASTRAAAFSALRAGLRPTCADLFADLDLAAHASTVCVEGQGYPEDLQHAAASAPAGPWMYTGALENRPDLIEQISGRGTRFQRPLWGNRPDVLQAVRDPLRVVSCLKEAGLPHPRCLPSDRRPPANQRWLKKPVHGAGGAGIHEANRTLLPAHGGRSPDNTHVKANAERFYWQQFIEGLPCSAVFVGDETGARLLGVTRQLVGESNWGAKPFAYYGSIGPMIPEGPARQQFEAVGSALTQGFSLRGLFGVDAILKGDTVWPVEVNPRYTASVEVLEHALGFTALALHRAVFEARDSTSVFPSTSTATDFVGKAILFAKDRVRAPETHQWLETKPWSHLPQVADIPRPGLEIAAGRPVLTVFARGDSVADCYRGLVERAAHYEAQLR